MAVGGTKEYFEYRGVSNAVYAPVTVDSSEAFTTGEVKHFTGVSEIAKSTESANEPHYYDNIPAIIVSSTGSDEISINASGIPFEILAEITGQYYDAETGMFVEQERTPTYWAFGYITQKTDGTEVLVWRLKGSFSIPAQTSATQDDGTDANGQEITYTGISTTHKFTETSAPAKAVNVDTSVNKTITADTFLGSVQTPDTIGTITPTPTDYTLSITQATDTTVTVTRGGTALTNGATIATGDVLTISVIGGTVTVNGEAFTSGDTYTVAGNVVVVSTKSE